MNRQVSIVIAVTNAALAILFGAALFQVVDQSTVSMSTGEVTMSAGAIKALIANIFGVTGFSAASILSAIVAYFAKSEPSGNPLHDLLANWVKILKPTIDAGKLQLVVPVKDAVYLVTVEKQAEAAK